MTNRQGERGWQVTNNLSVTVPVFHIVSRQEQEHPILTQRTITTRYRPGTATLVPQSSSPGVHSYQTQFICSACNQPVPIEVKQATLLPVHRAQLGFGNGRHSPLKLALAIIFSSPIAKTSVFFMISFFVSPLIYLESSISTTPGILPFLGAWGIAAVIVTAIYVLYVSFRLVVFQRILLPVKSRRNYGYGNPDCFNMVVWGMITNKQGSEFHASDNVVLNPCYERKVLYSLYKFGIPTWVAMWQ
jgi:hypothetical protein